MNNGNRVGPSVGYLYQLLAGVGWTSLPFLPRLRQPTLIVAGDDDPIIPLANARLLHRLIPKSRLHVYHGGHVAPGHRGGGTRAGRGRFPGYAVTHTGGLA